jgi:hypothetical protein
MDFLLLPLFSRHLDSLLILLMGFFCYERFSEGPLAALWNIMTIHLHDGAEV